MAEVSDSIYGENDGEALSSATVPERSSARCAGRRLIGASVAGVLVVASIVGALSLLIAPAPAALTVSHLSPHGLDATFFDGSTRFGDLVISTTNNSMAVKNSRLDLSVSEQTLFGHSVTTSRIMDKTFVSLQSATGKQVTVEANEGALEQRNLDLMFSQPEIDQRPKVEAAMKTLVEQRQPELKAMIDAAWNLDKGQLNINGMALPHVLPFVSAARDFAAAIDYQPERRAVESSSNPIDLEASAAVERRRLDEAWGGDDHGVWGDGSCQREGLPTDEGSAALRRAYSTSDCRGMCGPGCDCWSSLCGNCCWHRYCYEHDNCEDTWAFWMVVVRYSKDKCQSGYDCS